LRLQASQVRDAKVKVAECVEDYNGRGMFSSSHMTPGLSFIAVLCSNTQQEQQPQLPLVAEACIASLEVETNQYQVSQFRLLMQTVHLVKVVNDDISADRNKVQWG
jgi:hypothetical protein